MIDQLMELYSREDVFVVLAYLATQESEEDVLNTCAELASKIYWERKDLASVVVVSVFGLGLGWKTAEIHKGTEQFAKIIGVIKSIAYNLASYTWPGWDEAGVQIGRTDLAVGLGAAKTNLRLAHELSKGPLPLSRAYWVLGAHYLAQENYVAADENFACAASHAHAARCLEEVLLCEGFQALAQQRSNPERHAFAAKHVEEVIAQLSLLDNGPAFVEQIETAGRVFT